MKKREFKKLRLSRETLRDLEAKEVQKAAGGLSPMTGCWPTGGDESGGVEASGCEAC